MGDRVVAYYRVSTERQGYGGLGLEAQQEAIRAFLNGRAPLAEVVEIESGRRKDRPKLAEALRLCRLYRATLVIAKIDRLARNVAFVSNLMDSGVDFVAVDFPQADRLTLHILAAVAEHEARMISERTRAALAAAKARGAKLGGAPDALRGMSPRGVAASVAARRAKAARRAADVAPLILYLRERGASLGAVAAELTARGVPTVAGKSRWTAMGVKRAIAWAAHGKSG